MEREIIKFCTQCGSPVSWEIPEDDDHERFVCTRCHHIHYQNPLNIVGTIPVWEDKVLLCRRAIEPREGFWTLPAGHQELGESTKQGAIRETKEEAGALIFTEKPYIFIDQAFHNQSHLFYLGTVQNSQYQAGPESLECRWFQQKEIPWDQIAFRTVKKALSLYFEDLLKGSFPFHYVEEVEPEPDQ